MIARDWVARTSSTLRGFFSIEVEVDGIPIEIRDFGLHERDGRRWITLPSKPQLQDGRHRIDPATGKPAWLPVVFIERGAGRDRFQQTALAAVDRLLGGSG